MSDVSLFEQKNIREQLIDRVDVLDRVKELLLLSGLEMLTTQQVADYFEAGVEAIQKCYQRNKSEFDSDGTAVVSKKNLIGKFDQVGSDASGVSFDLGDGVILRLPFRGTKMFSKRAILRIGMLLRDSRVAQEVRTQLLNVFEKSDDTQRVEDIDTEQSVLSEMGLAFASGDITAFCAATMKYSAFKDRHIDQLKQDKLAMAAEILEWSDRSSVNKAVRLIAGKLKVPYGVVWKWLYDELRYKHGIGLSQRGSGSAIQYVKDSEWVYVQQSLCAICEDQGLSSSKIIREAKMLKVSAAEED